MKITIVSVFVLLLTGCNTDDLDTIISTGGSGIINNGTTGSTVYSSDLDDFTIDFDTSTLSEEETIQTDATAEDYDDYVENTEFKNIFTVTYSNGAVSVSPAEDADFTFTTNGAHLTVNATKKAEFILTGSASDGSFKIYSDSKFEVQLNGLTLTNPQGAAINSQSKKRMFLDVANGTTNSLCDGASYVTVDEEDMKGTIFSEGQIAVSGTGSLNITAKGKNGIASDQYIRVRKNTNIQITSSGTNGVKANDAIIIDGGVMNISVSAAGGKGLTTDGYFEQNGGRVTAITTGGVDTSDSSDPSGCAGVKADSIFTLNGGELNLKSSGQGGKGVSCDQQLYVNGGTFNVITSGAKYGSSSGMGNMPGGWGNFSTSSSNSVSPKGLKADGNLYINGGNVNVKCTGGEGSEGIESKKVISITGGVIQASCYDDCINASSSMSISGGYIYAFASNNDGVDSNGTLTISGGVLFASGATAPEEGIDCDNNTFAVTGGTFVGIGGATSSPTTSKCSQPSIIYTGSGSTGNLLSLDKNDGTNVFVIEVPRSYNQMTILMSSPDIAKGNGYVLSKATSVSGGNTFHNLTIGASDVTKSSTLKSYSISSMLTK
ncbi:MAG: carbohydrate-binding domain-containing protein [Bacteroidaceae bacterium]|nr:carbohydrate-binding domain-containing protein [Bacteroidaceae bacterium]